MGKIEPQLDRMKIVDLVEDAAHQDLTFLSMETGETTENLMQVVLAARLGAVNNLPAPLFFAFLRQQIPPDLPRPLLEASSQFTLIDALVKNVGSMIFAMPPDAQSSALLGAIALDLIDQQFTPEVERWVEGLQALRTTDLLDQPYSDTGSTLGELLKITQLSSARQQIFAKALASNTQSMSDFWSGLGGGNSGLTPDEAAGIQRVLSIGGFVQQYAPLVQSLNADFQSGRYTAMSQLATLSLQDWSALVGQTGTPANIEPAGDQSAADVFAASIYSQVTRTFPTTALSSRITQMEAFSEGDRQALTRFFDNNPKLELVSQNLPAYLEAQGGNVFAGINQEQQAAVIANTRALQRVLRVSSDTDAAHALLDLGLTSAAQIGTLGKQQFATLAGARLSQEVIDRVFESAAHRYAGTVALYMRNNFDAIGPLPRMIMNRGELVPIASAAVQRDSSLSALFGSQDYCMVDDCTSILSPAAYLCDLLMWLRNHSQGDHTALEVLIGRRGLLFLGGLLINRPPIQLGGIPGRRPDIANLLLNCPNTNTELPYIDLVIELLADKISPPTDPNSALNPPWKQTSKTATAAQLRAAPEYFNQQAFVTLAGASYPQSLPYSTGLDELRTYLQQWNLPLWQLREALLPLDGAPENQRADVAAEQLGMNAYALQLTTTPDAIPAATAWGLPGASGSSLAPVPVFLAASGLAYDQLTALLGSRWVQGKQNIQIVGGDDTCDTGTMRLSPAPLSDWLDRAHRFIRLWRSTAYEMWELDLLLTAAAIGAGNLDAQALIQMHDFWKLQAKTKLKVDEQLAFYRPIDTSSHLNTKGQTIQPLYARLFLNPTTTWIAPDADMAGLANGAAPGDPVLANHAKAIQPAVGVSSDDLVTLFGLTDGQLSLDTLSLIWRIATLAKTANYSVTDLIAVAQLLDPGDLAVDALGKLLASPAATLAFLDQVAALKSSPFGLDALTYLLTPPGADGSWATTSQMTDQDIAAALSSVGAAVAQLNATDEPSVEDKDKAIADAVVSAMAAGGASLAVDVTVRLLKLPDPTGTAPTLLDLLTDQATFLPIAITPQDDPNNPPPAPLTLNRTNCAAQFTAVQLFDKVALIVRALALGVDEIDWLLSNWSVYGGPDIANLPVTSGGAPVQPLGPLLSMLDLVKLERGFPAAPAGSAYPTLLELIGAIASGDIADE
ncbi:MAG: hypothetical protein LBQ32_05060, partial [Burkholderiaceae bacterium]|nr:hypothetical protein [Burkholderiaceae bacterium]